MLTSLLSDPNTRAKLRFALGLFISMMLALSIAWPLAVVTPIFVGIFLTKGSPFFGLKGGLVLIVIAGASCFVGAVIGNYLIHLPFVAICIISLLVFRIYYYGAGSGSPFVSLMGLIGVVALPIMAQQSPQLSNVFAISMFFGIALSIVLTTVMHGLLPDVNGPTSNPEQEEKPLLPDQGSRLRSTFISTAIVLPAVFFFFAFELVGGALILLLVLIMAQNPALDAGIKGSVVMLVANLIGGILAVFYYNFLVIVPEYSFLVISILLSLLMFATVIFSDKSYAPLFGSALTTFLLLTFLSTTGDGDGSDARFVARIIQIGLASIYIVCVSSLVNWLFERRPRKFKFGLSLASKTNG
jgi:MFS family permease